MDLVISVLLEVAFLEFLILVLLFVIAKKPLEEERKNEFIIKVEEKKEPKRHFEEKKFIRKESKIKKQKTAQFERFLILLIPLLVLTYILFSKYTGIQISILTIILIIFGILLISILIFFELNKKYS